MSFFRSPRIPPPPPPPPPPSLRTSSPASAGSPASSKSLSKRSSANRLTPPTSPIDETDPAPFVARPNDRVSLSQVLEPREATPPLDDIADAFERPNLYRASTSFANHEHSRSLYRELKSVRRGFGRPETPRSTSSPHTASEKADNTLFSLSSADASRYSSSSGSDDAFGPGDESADAVTPTITSKELTEAFQGFEGIQGLKRAHTHSGIAVPLEIRLRRASKEIPSRERQVSSVSTIRPANLAKPSAVRYASNGGAPHGPTSKSTPAGTALTHTYVHLFSPSDPEDERRASLPDGRRKLSATLQVVRSRDSVYEIIWEDEDINTLPEEDLQPSLSAENSSSDDSENIEPRPVSQPKTAKQSGEAPTVRTKMSRWSWGGELEPYSRSGLSTRRPTVYSTPPELPSPVSHSPISTSPSLASSAPPASTEPTMTNSTTSNPPPPSAIPDTLTTAFFGPPSTPNEIEQMPRRISVSRPPPTSYFGGTHLTVAQRRELLGKRKVSNIAPEEDHFASHRDSLVLAHHRIFHEDNEKAAAHVGDALAHGHGHPAAGREVNVKGKGKAKDELIDQEPEPEPQEDQRIAQLKRDTWHLDRSRPKTPTSLSPPQSPSPGSERVEFLLPVPQAKDSATMTATLSGLFSSSEPELHHGVGDGVVLKGILRPAFGRLASGQAQIKVHAETPGTQGTDGTRGTQLQQPQENERKRERSRERREAARKDEWYADALGSGM